MAKNNFQTVEELKDYLVEQGWSKDIELVKLAPEEVQGSKGEVYFKMLDTNNVFDQTGEIAYYDIPSVRESMTLDDMKAEIAFQKERSDIYNKLESGEYVNLRSLSDRLRNDELLVMAVLDHNPFQMWDIGDKLKDDKQFVLEELTRYSSFSLNKVSDRLKLDVDVVKVAMEQNGNFTKEDLAHILNNFADNKELVDTAIEKFNNNGYLDNKEKEAGKALIAQYTEKENDKNMTREEVIAGRKFLEISYSGKAFEVCARDVSLESKGKYNYCAKKDITMISLSNKKELYTVVEDLMKKHNCEKAYLVDNTNVGYQNVTSHYKVPAKVMKDFNIEVTDKDSYEVMIANTLHKDKEKITKLAEVSKKIEEKPKTLDDVLNAAKAKKEARDNERSNQPSRDKKERDDRAK